VRQISVPPEGVLTRMRKLCFIVFNSSARLLSNDLISKISHNSGKATVNSTRQVYFNVFLYRCSVFTRTWLYLRVFAIANPSVVFLSSVTFVYPTKGVETFGNISSPFCTLAIFELRAKFYGDRPKGTPPSGALDARGVAKCSDGHVRVSHLLMSFLWCCFCTTEQHCLALRIVTWCVLYTVCQKTSPLLFSK